eukprot:CAMPEP_0201914676 /NCGR_PEP_ID=MMETSP0903-20130614/4807_1 /ASSEMBLY_ACC=CAM_ASM_000552 /TAXON_ID=420261 /ORGANISM="Thalassiosira antarctica, Strain CCMP982" /LENGTH=41 /DNA_ID= /DNA_START= /DNA_END= /DNA_ORIENTATION=
MIQKDQGGNGNHPQNDADDDILEESNDPTCLGDILLVRRHE